AVQNVGNGSITIRVSQGESQIELLIEDSLKKEQMLSSKVANGQFGEMIAIDIDSDQALVNGVIRPISAKGEKPAEVDNKIFIPAEFAAVAFGSAVTEEKIIDGLKRLEYRGRETYLCSFNPKYSPIHISVDDDLRTIGRVLL
ncbi:MAG: hypothetical protein KH216_07805, partial [Clostridiales bacterium]|nr:hypothetical protein [Clostridiales bacterium]